MREGIISPKFANQFFRIDFEANPMPILSLYPIPISLRLEEVTLDVCGLEEHPRLISWSALHDLPRVKLKLPLICQIFNWDEEVEWEGIRLVDLLDFLKVDTHPEGYFAFYSRDRLFFEGLSRDEARDPRVLIAYGLNGAPLPEVYGGPVRLVVPFLQGYKSVKWLYAIRAFRHDPIGIKRLLGQSPSGELNEKWRNQYQILPPPGKQGDPPLKQTRIEPTEMSPFSPPAPLAPVLGNVGAVEAKEEAKRGLAQKGILKEVIAIVRPERHFATRQALEAAGIFSYTTTPVLGRSRQRGLKFQTEGGEGVAIKFLPKQYFSIVIQEEVLSSAVSALMKANRSGKGAFGDGKIFVLSVEDAIRISSGERGSNAV